MDGADGRAWVGVDVGGTFTDVARYDAGRWQFAKTLTTPADPSIGILNGITRVTQGADLRAFAAVVHGTTLVANAIIERKGARTALLTTAGFRDVLEIGREPRYDLFDLSIDKPSPLVPRVLRLEIPERLRADGTVVIPLDESTVRRVAQMLRAVECESVAVVFLHAFRNPAHEERTARILAEELPGIDISLSSRVSPEIGEYVRASTTAANAYVRPLVREYLARLRATLAGRGFSREIYLMQSNGAVVRPEMTFETPIRLIESGPAAGAIAAAAQGARCGFPDLISFDMGGTTAKVCVISDGQPAKAGEIEVARVQRFKRGSGLPLRVPVIEMIEIGAGGGSLAGVDSTGLVRVGPESAGADPGPACYDRGGERPTVTDADLVLGYLSATNFLGGEMPLSSKLAERAIAQVASLLDVNVIDAARGIIDVVNSHMATAIRLHTIERGQDPARYALFAFGGAGPVHAYDLAVRVKIPQIICPPNAGIASAIGLLIAPRAVEMALSRYARLDQLDEAEILNLVRRLEQAASEQLVRMGEGGHITVVRMAELRYAGQGHQITVPIPESGTDGAFSAALRKAFDATYRATYGHTISDRSIEALTWRVWAQATTPHVRLEPMTACLEHGSAQRGVRRVFFLDAGGFIQCPVYDRARLWPGTVLQGPAVVEERESTAVIGPSGVARVDDNSNLVINIDGRAGRRPSMRTSDSVDVRPTSGQV